MNLRGFQISVPDEQIEDLKQRLRAARLPADAFTHIPHGLTLGR
jgi:hypothetical protein